MSGARRRYLCVFAGFMMVGEIRLSRATKFTALVHHQPCLIHMIAAPLLAAARWPVGRAQGGLSVEYIAGLCLSRILAGFNGSAGASLIGGFLYVGGSTSFLAMASWR